MKNLFLIALLLFSATAFSQGSFTEEYKGTMKFTAGKIISLAEAMPDDKYQWGPMDGVRTVGGVLGHVTSANYFFSMLLGTPAEGVDARSFDNNDTKKADAIKNVQTSFDHLMSAVDNVSEAQMADMVDFPDGNKYSKRTIMFIAMSHMSEHMGQLIAYGRSNEIAPPWSQAGE